MPGSATMGFAAGEKSIKAAPSLNSVTTCEAPAAGVVVISNSWYSSEPRSGIGSQTFVPMLRKAEVTATLFFLVTLTRNARRSSRSIPDSCHSVEPWIRPRTTM